MTRHNDDESSSSRGHQWDQLRRRAGYRASTKNEREDQDSDTSSWSDRHWQHPETSTKAQAPTRDHLYDLIDAPGRDDHKHALFGMAKSFPEVTRRGYRGYLKQHLAEKADEQRAHGGDEEAEAGSKTDYEKRRGAFRLRDFGPFYRLRIRFHAEMAEFLGMFVFLAIGFASSCQMKVGEQAGKANYTTTVLAWGIGQMAGIYVAGGYSGAHLNPIITMNLWFFRGFPFQRMISFWIAQFFGALAASAWVFILYYPALKQLDPNGWSISTGEAFFTVPAEGIPVASAWFNEVTCTALIHITVFAVGDSHNISPARGMNALVIGFVVTALGSSFGYLTPFGMNPTRDFAPRIFLSMVGFPKQLWTLGDWWWVTGLFTAPFVGGFLGAFAYDLFIFDGPESPVNFPTHIKKRALQFWIDDIRHPVGRRMRRHEDNLPQDGFDENPYRGTVHLQGQPAQ